MKKIYILFLLLISVGGNAQQSLCKLIQVYESSSAFGSCINKDNNGFIYTAGRIGKNAITGAGDTIHNEGMYLTKVNTAGNEIWRANNILGKQITPRSILIDAAGNEYIVGNFYDTLKTATQVFSTNTIGARKFFIAKYKNNGLFLWIKVSSSEESCIFSADIYNDQLFLGGGFSGTFNYYGTTMTSAGQTDISLLKLDTAGNLLNNFRFGSTGEDQIESIKSDNNGNIFAGGLYSGAFNISSSSLISHGSSDCFVMKMNSSLNVTWVRTAGSNGRDLLRSIAISSIGNVFVVGECANTLTFDPSVYNLMNGSFNSGFIAEYSPSGAYVISKIVAKKGVAIDVEMVNDLPVICGRIKIGGPVPFDTSIPFAYAIGFNDGFYIIFDAALNAVSIGRYSEPSVTTPTDERCLAILPIDNQSFLIGGFAGSTLKMPDSIYQHISNYSTENQHSGGFVFLQKITVPNLTVNYTGNSIVPLLYSPSVPLTLNLNFNGGSLASANSTVSIGYPKTSINNYVYAGDGNFDFISDDVSVIAPMTNPPLGSGNNFLNFYFEDKNLMIRSNNALAFCNSFAGDSVNGPTIICAGDTILLEGSASYQNYSWYPADLVLNSTANQLISSPTETTTYYYNAELSGSCYVGSKVVIVNPVPVAPVVTANSGLLTSTAGVNYQWLLNGLPIPGATNQTYSVSTPDAGIYQVVITDVNGCSAVSANYSYTTVENSIRNEITISVYPNPSSDFMIVGVINNTGIQNMQMSLINKMGQLVLDEKIQIVNGNTAFKIDTELLANGNYLLNFKNESVNFSRRIMVIH